MPTCLYCRETKNASEFNREHVVPDAFGTFHQNFVLNDVVCSACNSYFGRTLDLKLARESIEGLDRYENKVRQPTGKTKFGITPSLTARINDGSFVDGAEVFWAPSSDQSRLVLHLFPQFGVTDGVRTTWFRTDQLPARTELEPHGFPSSCEVSVKCVGMDAEEAASRLAALGYNAAKPENVGGTVEGAEMDITISGSIDRVLRRAVAKIACNYLAYQYPAIAQMEQLAVVRRYIRYDDPHDIEPVSLSRKPLVVGATEKQVPIAHAVAVEWKNGHIVGDVTLFFRFRYRVLLADGGFLVEPTMVRSGHIFNLSTREILELTTDPLRGRALVPPTDDD